MNTPFGSLLCLAACALMVGCSTAAGPSTKEPSEDEPTSIAHLAGAVCARLGAPGDFSPQETPLIEVRYAGEKYARPSAEGKLAAQRLARSEGILLDPVYTGKAFAGLLDLLANGSLGQDSPVIFLHTGGLPGIFAFGSEDLLPPSSH